MNAYARIPQDEREVNGTSLDPLYPVWVCRRDIDPGYAAVIERLPDLHRTRGWGAPQALDYQSLHTRSALKEVLQQTLYLHNTHIALIIPLP